MASIPCCLLIFLLFAAKLVPSIQGNAPTGGIRFLVTDIAVTKSQLPNSGLVEFHGLLPGSKEAVILCNIVKTDRFVRRMPLVGRKHYVYTAKLVDPQHFQAMVDAGSSTASSAAEAASDNPTLLCLHGFATQPDSWIQDCSNYSGNATIIPIVWAASDILNPWRAYWNDRNNAQRVGSAFAPLLVCARTLTNKSLLCHSMGNFVLKWAANNSSIVLTDEEKFQDIFMVAPDTNKDLFSEPSGQKILNLVRNRVHVLHAKNDVALNVRQRIVLRQPALGLNGDPTGAAVNLDCISFSAQADRLVRHSYQFHPSAVAYYEQTMGTSAQQKN